MQLLQQKERTLDTRQEEIASFLENVSHLLGLVHGGLATILESPDSELRSQIQKLKSELDKRVSKLYYNEEIK